MKAILEFNLPEDTEDFKVAQKGMEYKLALEDVWNEVFRPNFKHGYSNEVLQELTQNPQVFEAIKLLSEIYQAVLTEYEIS